MKEFLNKDFYGNTIQDWAISFGIILAALIIGKILYWIIGKFVKKAAAKTKSGLDDLLVDKLEEPVIYGFNNNWVLLGISKIEFW